MWKVKATDAAGRTRLFACGTVDQVLDRLDELGPGFRSVMVVDRAGQECTAEQFRRMHDGDGGDYWRGPAA